MFYSPDVYRYELHRYVYTSDLQQQKMLLKYIPVHVYQTNLNFRSNFLLHIKP